VPQLLYYYSQHKGDTLVLGMGRKIDIGEQEKQSLLVSGLRRAWHFWKMDKI
jgi:hypothetical protein